MPQLLDANQLTLLIIGFLAVNLLLFIVLISLFVKLRRTRRLMSKLFSGTNKENIEQQLEQLLGQMEEWKKKQSDQLFLINRLSQRVAGQSGNLAMLRYNAFGESGSDLSFSLALVDDNQNGIVITSIYGREESRMYAKPIEQGKSMYNLSEEEQAVLKKASTMNG